MSLFFVRNLPGGAKLGVWHMDESASSFPQYFEEATTRYKNEARRKEYVCVRALLCEMNNGVLPTIEHEPSGKPILEDGRKISISHTKNYCSVILSDQNAVGVDIEYVSDRVNRIAHRFLRDDEKFSGTIALLLCWCAKETVYKLFSEDELLFEDMFVEPFEVKDSGNFFVRNLKRNVRVEVFYQVTEEYALTYSI
ncbi:MAG: 4'-phosphopantetheinyl transferase superfamily protein [Prevotella sp.]|nr:4'-phosphopantetheinyl transferase superfamily protein [Prevotella sp.]